MTNMVSNIMENIREKFKDLIKYSLDLIFIINLEGNFIDVNAIALSNLGYNRDELVKLSFKDIIDDEQIPKVNTFLKKLKEQGTQFKTNEYKLKTKDNDIIHVEIYGIPLKEERTIRGVLFIGKNITGYKKLEQKLKVSEEKYLELLETSSVGILEFDVKNREFLHVNPKLLEILSHEFEDLERKKGLLKFIHPDDYHKFFNLPEKKRVEFRIFDKNGTLKWLSGTILSKHDKKGEFIGFRLWVEEITEKKRYEKLIYELNIDFLHFTVETQENIILLLKTCQKLLEAEIVLYAYRIMQDKKKQYQILTSSNERYLYDPEDFKEKIFANELFSVDNDYPQIYLNLDEKKYVKTDPFIIEHKIKGCYGKLIKSQNEFNSSICALYREIPVISHEDQLILFLICDGIEIEQRRWQVQQNLEEQNKILIKINKFKIELLNRTSHELKTPLVSIKGFTDLLLELYHSKLDPEVILIMEEIKDGGRRLEEIINSLLESSKLDQEKLDLNISHENLSLLIKKCAKDLQGMAKLRNHSIDLKIHENLTTKFDQEKINEVISNLLTNAIKYTPPGRKIVIQSKIKDNFYIISVKDEGIGIIEEEKSHLFKKFGKVERYGQGLDIDVNGSGFGLYISKKIVKLHGGKIWLESEGRNKGSTFHFSLPIISDY